MEFFVLLLNTDGSANRNWRCNPLLFCKCCSKFPQFTSGNVNLVKGFSGNNQGYKEETFARHENYHSSGQHKKCKDAWDKMNLGPIASSLAPDPKTWQKKISHSLNAQLCAKFVASNLICTEAMSGKKFEPVLDSFKLVGRDVGHHASQSPWL